MGAGAKVGLARAAWAKLAIGACMACLSIGLLVPVSSANATQAKLWTTGQNCGQFNCPGTAGETYSPRGIATDPVSGHLYVADLRFRRIDEFNAWGIFVKAWGWGVRDGSPELQSCTAETGCQAAAGSLGFGVKREAGAGSAGEFSSPQGVATDSAGNVYVVDWGEKSSRIQKFDSEGNFLRTWGGGVVSGGAAGTGDLTSGSTKVVNLTTTSKAFEIGQTVTGAGIPAGALVRDLGVGTMTLSRPATASASGVAISAAEGAGNVPTNERKTVTIEGSPTGGTFTLSLAAGELAATRASGSNQLTNTHSATELTIGSFRVGDGISGEGIPTGATIAAIDAGAGSLTLSANATSSGTYRIASTETTAPIPYNASAAEVQAKLEALAGIGAGNAVVEGAAGGPWTIEFKGPLLGDVNLEPFGSAARTSADGSGLAPSGTKVAVATVQQGASAAEVCAVASACRSGIEGTGDGQFGGWPPNSSFIAIGPADQVYVGSVNRIEEFNTAGIYQGEIKLPETGSVGSLAVDPNSGDVYFAYPNRDTSLFGEAKHNVFRLDPASGKEVGKPLEVGIPTAVATGADGSVYVFDSRAQGNSADPGNHIARLLKFDKEGKQIEVVAQNKESPSEKGSQFEANEFDSSTGIATNAVTEAGEADVYVGNAAPERSFVSAYGPPPGKWPPPPAPPTIDKQYAISVGANDATLGAAINPHFWRDATYYVEYGTGKCSEGGCQAQQPAPPGSALGGRVTDEDVATAGIFLAGLEPSTTYHYRFVAQSGGGGPVIGEEATFITFRGAEAARSCPANEAVRIGASAALPDCRAYEIVSPLDKVGGDAEGFGAQSSTSGDAFTYSSRSAFGELQGAPLFSQYLARRDSTAGWSNIPISPPQEGENLLTTEYNQLTQLYKVFSPDLSTAWNLSLTEPVLGPGGQPGYPNIYRRDNSTETYQACITAKPALPEPALPALEGVTDDQQHAIFGLSNKVTPDADGVPITGEGITHQQLYECSFGEGEAGLRLVSILPSGVASTVQNTVGTHANSVARDLDTIWAANALSEDGSRVFWTAGEPGAGPLYVRVNADQPASPFLHGAATGTGDLIGPASGTGTLLSSSFTVSSLATKEGFFIVGQAITSPTAGLLAPGTTVVACSPSCGPAATSLTLSAKPLKIKAGAELIGEASEKVSNLATETGAFATGQEISGPGIPTGTTISACSPSCGPAATSLTLSAKAVENQTGAAFSATSECAEALKACTYPIAGSAGSVNPEAARFWGASSNGSRVLVQAEVSGQSLGDLYLFDVEKEIAGEAPMTLIAHKTRGVLGASENLSRIYFLSDEAIGGEGTAGEPNLYLYEAGGAPTTTLVGTLTKRDTRIGQGVLSSVNDRPDGHASRVSPDGVHLAFMSSSSALAESAANYDNVDLASGEPDAEVYRYDAGLDKLACLSCNPSRARPSRGRMVIGAGNGIPAIWAAARLAPWASAIHPGNALSEDGRRVFFESYEALALADTNGKADVYEWEEAGTGDCEAGIASYVEASEGCLSLISSGKSPGDSRFVDATPDGHDAFIATAASLLPQDPGSVDIYDARVDGGFESEAAPAAACEGEACQGSPEAPNDPTPASSSFEGAGNVNEEVAKPKPCAKGKVRRKGRCVAKSHKRAHGRHRRAGSNRRAGR